MDNGVTQSQRCALRQPDHAVLGCVIDGPARNADETADRRIVDDGPATLFSHLEQLVFHAEKDTAETDRIHSLEFLTSGTLFSNDKIIDWFLLTVMPRQLRSFMPHRRGLVHRADAAIAPQVRSADACSREPDDCIRWLGDLWLGSVLKTDVPGSIKHGSSHGSSLL